MKKQIVSVVEYCDVCNEYPARTRCYECKKSVCHSFPCEKKLGRTFQTLVKNTTLATVFLCYNCIAKRSPLLERLETIETLRREWFRASSLFDERAMEAECEVMRLTNYEFQ